METAISPEAALELLASRIGKNRMNDTRGKGFAVNPTRAQGGHPVTAPTVAEQLCEWLGYLPLGLELVGCYLEQQPNLSLQKMLLRLHKQQLSHQLLLRREDDPTRNLTTGRGIAAAFELSWQLLNEDAKELGCLLSMFALAPIPWAQVESVLGQIYLPGALLGKLLNGSKKDPEAEIENLIETLQADWEKRRSALVRLHLLQPTDEETYCLHPLIWELLREKLEQLEQVIDIKQAFCQVMVAVAKQIPDEPTRELIEEVTPAMPHVAETATAWKDFLSDEDLIWPFVGLGRFYQGQGFYNQAAAWFEQCREVARTRLGEEHPDVAQSLNHLAFLYDSQGRFSEAEPLYMQALEICERRLGANHHNSAIVRENLENLRAAIALPKRRESC